jgi:hypothetical protein
MVFVGSFTDNNVRPIIVDSRDEAGKDLSDARLPTGHNAPTQTR